VVGRFEVPAIEVAETSFFLHIIGFGVTAACTSPKRWKFEKATSNGGFFHSAPASRD